MQQLSLGTLLRGDTYRIEKILGQGSFGITYLAEHVNLGRKVAIKEFFMKELNSRGEDGSITGMTKGSLSYNYARKFQKEAQNLSRLDHPNIVRVTDSFEENGTFYYVMDYIDGVNLNDYVNGNAISESEAISIIKDVADALIYMHEEKHMLHLDLKPGNIMRCNSDGHIFLIDFGLSKHYDTNGAPETSTTIGLGTPGYAPIEQANLAKNGEFRPTIDVYALAATLYKLLTRETPPAASDIVSDDELVVNKLRTNGIADSIIEVVVKAMLPNVKKRVQTIRDFKDMLLAVVTTSKKAEEKTVEGVEGNEETIVIGKENEETELIDSPSKRRKTRKSKTPNVIDNEETEIIGSSAKEDKEGEAKVVKNFDEATYVINSKYKNAPVSTQEKAASGNVAAAIAYGIMALRGEGIRQDFDAAYRWFTFAKNKRDYRGVILVEQWDKLKEKYGYSASASSDSFEPSYDYEEKSNKKTIIFIVVFFVIAAITFILIKCFGDNNLSSKISATEIVESNSYQVTDSIIILTDGPENMRVYSYTGEVDKKTELPCGKGTAKFDAYGDIAAATYVGHFKDGLCDDSNDNATLKFENGDMYEGSFSRGYYAIGTYRLADGGYYKGTFTKGVPQNGTWYNSSGTIASKVLDGMEIEP